jgi:ubiquinone/menaquinone biosynthesis C-methylase UbiE
MIKWFYDEFKQIGLDFENEHEVQLYDEKYKGTRNLDLEATCISDAIELKNESVILEIGTGTGELALRLAKQCKKVIACDISKTMLSYANKKAENQNIENIEFVCSGFLNNKFGPEIFNAVISQLSLHHLPDFWKSVAINNISKSLKPGGKFYLLDSILSFDVKEFENSISNTIQIASEKFGEKIVQEIIINLRDEYPTYDWIIEGLLKKNGFRIDNKIKYTDIMAVYVSSKEK